MNRTLSLPFPSSLLMPFDAPLLSPFLPFLPDAPVEDHAAPTTTVVDLPTVPLEDSPLSFSYPFAFSSATTTTTTTVTNPLSHVEKGWMVFPPTMPLPTVTVRTKRSTESRPFCTRYFWTSCYLWTFTSLPINVSRVDATLLHADTMNPVAGGGLEMRKSSSSHPMNGKNGGMEVAFKFATHSAKHGGCDFRLHFKFHQSCGGADEEEEAGMTLVSPPFSVLARRPNGEAYQSYEDLLMAADVPSSSRKRDRGDMEQAHEKHSSLEMEMEKMVAAIGRLADGKERCVLMGILRQALV
jgi:hypothetical protein